MAWGCSASDPELEGNTDQQGGPGGASAKGEGASGIIKVDPSGTGGGESQEEEDPCLGPMPPADCMLDYEPSGPGCGDGEINDEGEECDDGNGLPGDGCSGLCRVEPNYVCDDAGCNSTIVCGDGTTQPGEVCDDGNQNSDDGCSSDCFFIEAGFDCPPGGGECEERNPCLGLSPPASCFPDPGENPYCGDGEKNNTWEQCDDGNALPGDGCNGTCKEEPNWDCSSGTCQSTIVCGDGLVSGGEVCDDGDTNGGNGCEADCFSLTPGYSCPPNGGSCNEVDPCTLPNPPASCLPDEEPGDPKYCGDGTVNVTGEECDDGNTLPGDGCNGACLEEPNWDCSGASCVYTIECGDGKREGNEVCDDGNTSSGDGCAADCSDIEDFYSCPPAGGPCTSTVVCGDGRITGDEQCEDGDTASGDGCDSDCRVEPGYYCLTVGAECQAVPACGDGKQTAGEECDDGDTSGGDGCSAACDIENGYACPTPGEDCVAISIECGDGGLGGDEECDDGNTASGDGCSASCLVEAGFVCSSGGAECTAVCGDGLLRGQEICDDGNTASGDGCSASCTWEPGFSCKTTVPHDCEVDTCGNGKVGNDEACDDGNLRPGDGCAPDCTAEPACTYGTDGCSSGCGDGLVINEECDDGNTRDGDGCSSQCKEEKGFACSQPSGCAELRDWDHDQDPLTAGIPTCVQRIPVTYRDFNATHPDFEPGPNSVLITGLVAGSLDGDGKPVYVGPEGDCNEDGDPCITSDATFAEWFRDVPGKNATIVSELLLWDRDRDPEAANYEPNLESVFFVNRWGQQGQKWGFPEVDGVVMTETCGNKWSCSEGESPSATCTCNGGYPWNTACNPGDPSHIRCFATIQDGGDEVPFGTSGIQHWYMQYESGYQAAEYYEGNPTFFPLDDLAGVLNDTRYQAAIAPLYGGNWDPESNYVAGAGADHNFHFTSEIRRWFQYDAARTYQLDFTGDDDVWVFINGKLAVDIGSFHPPENGVIELDQTNAASFDLVDGKVYEIAMFQAERRTEGSTYYLTLNGFNSNPSRCTSTCGDGIVASDEECDDGENDGGYAECQPGCVQGPLCGDGMVDAGEACDNGSNLSGYNDKSATACGPGCARPKTCGDGTVDFEFGEVCDQGAANGDSVYDGCTNSCQLGPYCGDGVQQASEECDDGVNDGAGGCGPGCVVTVACGNGQVDPGEECDDGVNDGSYGGCTAECLLAPYCGDGAVDPGYGETCDDTVNDGGYGGCNAACQFGPRCGDGQLNGSEVCDDGTNDGSYGSCGLGCSAGPRCGDGKVQGDYEECDDGTNDGKVSACEPGCVLGPYCGDATVDAGEQCDDGANDGGYGQCAPMCTWGPRCGDGQVQGTFGEECDDGTNDGGYGECAQNCQLGPHCGDGQVNGSETCDDGVNKGSYGGCTPDCALGPYCGDGIKQAEEQCDDGTNDGSVSDCQPGCILGPGCGDGILQAGEKCDLGPSNSYDYGSCRPDTCTWGPNCGDGVVQGTYEQCDDGVNPGGYGECAQNCRLGPYCGDGVVNGNEICDDGVNDGGYGECAPACKLGPYCGDGKLHASEECDDGNRNGGDGCGPACKSEDIVH